MEQPDCEGSGRIVELVGFSQRKSAMCPVCEYVDTFPLDVAERDGKLIGRVSPHEIPTPTLMGTFEELGWPDPNKLSPTKT